MSFESNSEARVDLRQGAIMGHLQKLQMLMLKLSAMIIAMLNIKTKNRSKKQVFSLVLTLYAFASLSYANDPLVEGFNNPPASAKAQTWWHWINGNVTREGITADLEAMKRVGIQEAQIFNVNLGDPRGPAAYLSPLWLDLLKHSAYEAKRLGLELGFHNAAGWSSSGGPWVTPEHSMQRVVFSEVTHKGGTPFNACLAQPKSRLGYYRDIAVLAFPKPNSNKRIDGLDYKSLSGRIRNHLAPDSKPIPASAVVSQLEIIDLTSRVADDGYLEWMPPPGEWVILRLGHTPTGKRNRPAAFGGHGLECDKMSREAVDAFWEGGITPIINGLGPLVGPVLKSCLIDSYEVGACNWTPNFQREFHSLSGYDCSPYLPALAGYYVESGEISERFLWDFRRTIGDLMAKNYYAYFRERCHQHGMQFSVEPYWGPFDNMQIGEAGNIVMCEFWSGDVAFFDSPKFVASIAKLNGDRIVGAEAFTGTGGWVEHPATIKSIGDKAWAQGINRFIFHSYVHQPWNVGPGLTLSYHGLEFNRLNTWWEPAEAFLDYIARSQFMLQQGQSVADVLVFTGEASPNNAMLMPEIKASGYDYDLIGANKIGSLRAEDGLVHTSAGSSYRALVLPKTSWMRPETLKKLEELVEAGVKILGPKPEKSPSLQGFPDCDEQVSQISERLWGKRLVEDVSIVEFLKSDATPPDFDVEEGTPEGLSYIHRRVDECDIYFVANSAKEGRKVLCRFRVSGKQPELWNAETGGISNAPEWKQNSDGTTSVSIQFEPEGSVLVVFRQPATSEHIVKSKVRLLQGLPMPLPNLEIMNAKYGTFLPDGLVDVTESVAEGVVENHLRTKVSRKLCDCDPAPGYKKELRIRYRVGDTVHETHAMEQETIAISSDGKGELEILRAVFGKFDDKTKSVPADSLAKDVTEEVKSMVASGTFGISVDDGLSDESADLETAKELRIVYSTDGVVQKRALAEGGMLELTRSLPASRFTSEDNEVTWETPYPGQLIYSTSSGATGTIEVETVPEPLELPGPWEVRFPNSEGETLHETYDELTSWSSSSNEKIKHFSGTATYSQQLVIPSRLIQPDIALELDLGSVRVIAEVLVNGKKLGILWKFPFRMSLEGIVHEGENDLEVRVTNLWPNRLIGDEHLSQDFERRGRAIKKWPKWLLNATHRPSDRVSFAGYKHWQKDSPLPSSGMLGPVTIQPYVRSTMTFGSVSELKNSSSKKY